MLLQDGVAEGEGELEGGRERESERMNLTAGYATTACLQAGTGSTGLTANTLPLEAQEMTSQGHRTLGPSLFPG